MSKEWIVSITRRFLPLWICCIRSPAKDGPFEIWPFGLSNALGGGPGPGGGGGRPLGPGGGGPPGGGGGGGPPCAGGGGMPSPIGGGNGRSLCIFGGVGRLGGTGKFGDLSYGDGKFGGGCGNAPPIAELLLRAGGGCTVNPPLLPVPPAV